MVAEAEGSICTQGRRSIWHVRYEEQEGIYRFAREIRQRSMLKGVIVNAEENSTGSVVLYIKNPR